jgi:16S rRNA processing protein RimM
VEVHTDVPERFTPGMRLFALAKGGKRRELKLEEFWPHKEWLVLKFAGVDSMSEAETLIGNEVQVPASERAHLEPGWTYISELIGCKVFAGDREVGELKDVEFGAGEAPLLLVKSGANSYEIPFAEAYLKGVDLKNKRIDMELPEGLLEVNAPLTPEEKKQQHQGS